MNVLAHGASAGSVWTYAPNPEVWLIAALMLGGYFWIVRKRRSDDPQPGASRRQKAFFVAGVGTLWLASDWPLHGMAEGFLFTAHMVQHMTFWLVTPPLLILGTPSWLLRRALVNRSAVRIARVLTRPAVAFFASNAMIVLIHWPVLVQLQLRSDMAHAGVHAFILMAAGLMWWPVLGRLPELGRLTPPLAMFYLFLQSILPTVPASFLTFGNTPLYEDYLGVPAWGISAIQDQQISGLLMKIGGGVILWVVIAFIFFRWHAREELQERLTSP